ncbi:MAG: site-2 protease family protein [Candidatus Aenigmatarchaeota archaeon]
MIYVLLLVALVAGWFGIVSAGFMQADIAYFLMFISVIVLILYADRKKIKLHGIVFMRRTKKGKDFITSVANRSPKLWSTLGTIGVVVAIFALVISSYLMIKIASSIIIEKAKIGAAFILPGPVSSPTLISGALIFPWWIWVIGVMAVMIPHEFFHGIMFRLYKIRIKSVGWLLLAILPGAFVEPDERQLKAAKRSVKLKAYAAGSFANLIVAFIFMLIVILLSFAKPAPMGLFYFRVNDSPAYYANMTGFITEIGGMKIVSFNDISSSLSMYKPGDEIIIKTMQNSSMYASFNGEFDLITPKSAIISNLGETREYKIMLAKHPDNGGPYIGIANPAPVYEAKSSLLFQTIYILVWVFLFSLGIGIINLLPLKPLDGGLLFEEILSKFTTRSAIITKVVSIVMLALLVFAIIGPFVIGLF